MNSYRIESGPSGYFSFVFSSCSCLIVESGQDLSRIGGFGWKTYNKMSLFWYQSGMPFWLDFSEHTCLLFTSKMEMVGHNGLWSKIEWDARLRNSVLRFVCVGKMGQGVSWLYNIVYYPRFLYSNGNGYWYYWIMAFFCFEDSRQVWKGVDIKLWNNILLIYYTGFFVQVVSLVHGLNFSHLVYVEADVGIILESLILDQKDLFNFAGGFLVIHKDSVK